jgi:hypothetical protein
MFSLAARGFSVGQLSRLRAFLASQFFVGQPLPDDLPNGKVKAVAIVHVEPLIVAEHLLVKIPLQVEGLDTDVCSFDSTFQ